MLKRIDSLLEKLLNRLGRNRLLAKIARRVLLAHYIRKGFERIYHFYAVARFEKGLDPFIGGYYSRPWIKSPPGLPFSVKNSERNLIDIKGILDEKGLRYWLIMGTFLGAYRDQAIIPYDGDTDLAMYSEDFLRLVCCEDAFAKEGFYLGVTPGAATLYRNGEHTDFYFYHLDKGKRIDRGYRIDESAFETFNEIQFLGRNWRILNEPERWLEYLYGEDWRIPKKGVTPGGEPLGGR